MTLAIVIRGTVYETLKPSKARIDVELTVTLGFTSHVFANWLRIIREVLEKSVCFVKGQDQKEGQKHNTKELVEFHNHLHALTMPELI